MMKSRNDSRTHETPIHRAISVIAAVLLFVTAASATAAPVTFTVDTTDDTEPVAPVSAAKDANGKTSLRAAIMAANEQPDASTIHFSLPGGIGIIGIAEPLPEIIAPVVIDGGGQVVLKQTNAKADYGLLISGGRSLVRGLIIEGFAQGIRLQTLGSNAIQGNVFGDNNIGVCLGTFSGADPAGGSIGNLIGGATLTTRNAFVRNTICGILSAYSSSNVIAGNFIGVQTNNAPGGNYYGIILLYSDTNVIGGKVDGSGNIIANSDRDGILIAGGQKNIIFRNAITGNKRNGVALCSAPTTTGSSRHSIANKIGGSFLDGTGNHISGNTGGAGVLIAADGDVLGSNKVQGNIIGTDELGKTPAPNDTGVAIYGSSLNSIGGKAPGTGNLISANTKAGLVIVGHAWTLSELLANVSLPAGTIRPATLLNVVQGNVIGSDFDAEDPALGNGRTGIAIAGASRTIIGGTTAATGNKIGYNGANTPFGPGISISNSSLGALATQNQIIGNAIQGNDGSGILVDQNANGNVIGGKTKGMGNVVFRNGNRNDNAGIELSNSDTGVIGNSIRENAGASGIKGDAADGIHSLSLASVALVPLQTSGAKIKVGWTLSDTGGAAGSSYRIEFFSNADADTAQGENFLGATLAKLADNHAASGTMSLPKGVNFITATVTLLGDKGIPKATSRFSSVLTLPAAAAAALP